ncbi:uncharacterized protein LOC127836304 [Dreissena polymorpha]|uniref:C1q domain-containing protein n=1 Tax=Dreissena polymorpha TaxID=45954 RepID=A0A9D4FUL3_DREPO|nr:uncharacterized protein LOC127836304 [Dreissena polymorpha]KAH3804586.1 hypothetical protein DPMN_132873 [Dreissena polymorpha]
MWNLVLCGLSGILLGVLFSFQRSCPICSKFDYDEKLLERVIRNDILLNDALDKITETKAKVEHVLTRIIEDNAKAVNTLDVKRKELDDNVESFINSVTRNVSVTVEEMKASLKSLVLQTDNELKAKTRQIDEKVEDFFYSASQAVHRNVTDLSSAVQLLVERTASELDIIKDQLKVPTSYFRARITASYTELSGAQDVVFPTVDVNEGQGYDPSTGKFTASIHGMYLFSVQYCVENNKVVHLEIVHGGKTLQRSTEYDSSAYFRCVTMQVSSVVAMGDMVWVRSTESSMLFSDSIRYNSFSGTLIHV